MNMNTIRFLFVAFMLCIFGIFNGCAEVDEMEQYHIQCGCSQAKEALIFEGGQENMPTLWTEHDTACDALLGELAGKWIGQGDSSDRRLIMEADGAYKVQERRGSKWATISLGTYWVEYELYQGLLRPELHMTIPGSDDDYVVRYHLDGDELHLEEPTDGESEMVYVRKVNP